MMGVEEETWVRGVRYPSRLKAAKALGVGAARIHKALSSGREDRVGTGTGSAQRVSVTCDGEKFSSLTKAAHELGLKKGQIVRAFNRAKDARKDQFTVAGKAFHFTLSLDDQAALAEKRRRDEKRKSDIAARHPRTPSNPQGT